MTVLCAMPADAFAAYLEKSVVEFAAEKVKAGSWPAESALDTSRAEFAKLLPQGSATPDNYLFEIKDAADGPALGVLWLAAIDRSGFRSAYVYDLSIKPEWRRQGHAQRAFKAMEQKARELGLNSIGLHVFGHNPNAQALYAKLGYAVTGINMAKQLVPE